MRSLKNIVVESSASTGLSASEKNLLKRKAANRILAGYGITANSWNVATTYGFSFDNFRGHSKVYEDVQKLLTKEGIKFTTSAGSMHLEIRISTRGDNLDKFVKLGEKIWKEVLKKYLPMLDELEKIQDKLDTSKGKSTYRFNYLVSRSLFADYYRNKLLKNEEVYNYENMIKNYSKLLEVQNDVEAVKELYEKNKRSGLGNFDPKLANLLDDEYERLTGEKL